MLFDYLSVRLNVDKAAGKDFKINVNVTDENSEYTLSVKNLVLNYTTKQAKKTDVTISLSMDTMHEVQLKETDFDRAISDGKVKLTGNKAILDNFLAMLDDYNF